MELAGKVNSPRKVPALEKPKVKVQYIQAQPLLVQTKSNFPSSVSAVQFDDEVENVEYLEDCQAEEYNVASNVGAVHDKQDSDHFYPNAVHCLMSLYQAKYEQLTAEGSSAQRPTAHIWDDISDDMKESYFDFDSEQVKRKYTKLRTQYFAISSKQDIEAFYYFTNMHEIYNDKRIAAVLNGANAEDAEALSGQSEGCVDNWLFAEAEAIPFIEASNRKEVAFMDLVEKELQAMEQEHELSKSVEVPSANSIAIKHEVEEVEVCSPRIAKRSKPNKSFEQPAGIVQLPTAVPSEKSSQLKNPAAATSTHLESETTAAAIKRSNVFGETGSEMTLAAYNAAQQQRHNEKMELLRRTLQLQERVVNMQHSIMEQLLKRI